MGITEKVKIFVSSGSKMGVPQNLCNAFWLRVLTASIWTGCLPLFSVSLSFQDNPTHLPCPQCVGHTRAATNCEVNKDAAFLGWLVFLICEMGGLDQMNWSLRCFVTEFLPSWAIYSCWVGADIFPPGIPTTKISILARKSPKFWRQT